MTIRLAQAVLGALALFAGWFLMPYLGWAHP
jgi:hypothetical protein